MALCLISDTGQVSLCVDWGWGGSVTTEFQIIHLFAAEGIRAACQSSFTRAALAQNWSCSHKHTCGALFPQTYAGKRLFKSDDLFDFFSQTVLQLHNTAERIKLL